MENERQLQFFCLSRGFAAGQSVIFTKTETETATANDAAFKSLWFGANPPVGLLIGKYTGALVGLSTSGDAVNIYDADGTLQANVSFGASDAVAPYQSFDNAVISQLSVAGVNGAFIAANGHNEIGSLGSISAVPVPAAVWLFGSGLMGLSGFVRKHMAVWR